VTAVTENVESTLRTELATVKTQAALTITDQTSYDKAALILTNIKTWRKKWKEYWYGPDEKTGSVPLAYASWKSLVSKFSEADKPAETVENTVKQSILTWDQEQTRLSQERQRIADEGARKKEADQRAAQSVEMELAGADDSEIEAMITAPSVAVAAPVQATYTRASGIGKPRDNWCVKVNSLKDMCKAIGGGKFKLNAAETAKAVEFFESLLKPHATANQLTMAIPGCAAVNNPTLSARVK
jgi:hypothetical protein